MVAGFTAEPPEKKCGHGPRRPTPAGSHQGCRPSENSGDCTGEPDWHAIYGRYAGYADSLMSCHSFCVADGSRQYGPATALAAMAGYREHSAHCDFWPTALFFAGNDIHGRKAICSISTAFRCSRATCIKQSTRLDIHPLSTRPHIGNADTAPRNCAIKEPRSYHRITHSPQRLLHKQVRGRTR